jgi:HEAT repeat protein
MVLRYAAVLFSLLSLCISAAAQDAGSTDARERARAARALGQRGSEAIPALHNLLKDPDLNVRLEAVKAIVNIGTQHSLDPLVDATRDSDPEIQIRAADGLVDFYLPGYVKTGLTASIRRVGTSIRGKFTDVNDQVIPAHMEVRSNVIDALGKLARGGSSMESRANAARAAGVLRGKEAIPDLLEAVRSKDTQVIYEVLIALQKIRDPSAAGGIAFLLRDLNDKVQVAALETTGLLQNKEALPRLYDALKNARNDKIRRAALTAIAMLPDVKSRPVYEQYIGHKDALTRAAAAEGFARLKDPADLPMLEARFQRERKMNPRLSLAFALVMHGKTELDEFSPLQYLVNTLNSSSFRGVARPFLVELARDTTTRESLYGALPGGTKHEKILLAQVLARSGDEHSIPHLEMLGKDSEQDVSLEAMQALRALRARLE